MSKARYFFFVFAGIMGFALMACGNVTPAGAKIIISPDSVKWTVSSTLTTTTGYYVINHFDVLITDEDDVPLNGMKFEARLDLAPNLSDPTVLQLMDKDNNPVVAPFKAETDERGTYRLGVNIPLGVEFLSNLQISSGNAFNSVPIEETLE